MRAVSGRRWRRMPSPGPTLGERLDHVDPICRIRPRGLLTRCAVKAGSRSRAGGICRGGSQAMISRDGSPRLELHDLGKFVDEALASGTDRPCSSEEGIGVEQQRPSHPRSGATNQRRSWRRNRPAPCSRSAPVEGRWIVAVSGSGPRLRAGELVEFNSDDTAPHPWPSPTLSRAIASQMT